MFLFLLENNNKKDAIISSITTNIISTILLLIIVLIIVLTSICNKLLKLLLNTKCRLTEKYALTHTLNIRAIINKINLLIF